MMTHVGAICLELLTPDGWSQAYSLEAVIVQLMTTIAKGLCGLFLLIFILESLFVLLPSFPFECNIHTV